MESNLKTVADVAGFNKYVGSEKREASVVSINHPLDLESRLERITQTDYDNYKYLSK